MGMEKFLIKIFKFQLALKCFPRKVCISGKISLNSQKSNVVNMNNAFSQQNSINIIAFCIRKCMLTKFYKFSQKYLKKLILSGENSLRKSNKTQIQMIRVKSFLKNL
jgi:hypothetical protein